MDELLKAIAVLVGHADKAEVVKVFGEKAGALKQLMFQEGFDKGYGKKEGELTTAQTKLGEVEGELTKAKADLATAQKANPDVAAIHKQYQDAAAETLRKHTEAMTAKDGLIVTKETERTRADLTAKLVARGVNPAYAEVLAERPGTVKRFKIDPKTGELQILQDGREIPLAPANGKGPVDLLVEELVTKVPAEFLKAGADAGSGDKGGAGGGAGGTGIVARIQKEQADKKAAAKSTKAAAGVDGNGVPDSVKQMAVGPR